MRNSKKRTLCILAAASTSLLMNIPAMASENTIALQYQKEDAWSQIAMTNDDAVTTGVNIRSAASENSSVVGCLYYGGAAWVINKGNEWTEIYSGGITGFVKNEYLVYGEDARGLAAAYGTEGVTTTWDDVKLYSKEDSSASSILTSLDSGSSYILTQDNGHWLEVQNGADSTAYVSSEDVSRVLLLDTAVPVNAQNAAPVTADTATQPDTDAYVEETQPATDAYVEETQPATDAYVEETQPTTDAYVEETQPATDAYVEETQPATDAYVEETQPATDTSGDGSYYDADTGISYDASTGLYYDAGTGTYYDAWWNPVNPDGTSQTEAPETSAPETDAYQEETQPDTEHTDDGSYYDADTGISYDASTGLYYDSGTGTYYDAWWNPVNPDGTSQTEAPETSVPETETPETQAPETEAPAPSNSDDVTLLGALIYCEAGNQSYEGMVAVGAVVMNRVYSSSFPNSISEVIYQSGQFTPAYSGALSSALASGVPSTCYQARGSCHRRRKPGRQCPLLQHWFRKGNQDWCTSVLLNKKLK